MKKVCHVTSAHLSDDARIFRLECVSLASSGYDVYLVAKGDSRTESGVKVVGVGKEPASKVRRILFFSKKVYKEALKLDCDIYHLHDPELLLYAKKLKKHGKTVIFDSHENTLEQIEEKEWIPVPFRRVLSAIYKKIASSVFAQIDGLISVTPHIVDQLKKINPNTWMITNYPRLTERKEKGKSDGFSVCFTGGIDRQWNHDCVVCAISQMDDIRYRLCGWANEPYLNWLKKMQGWDKVDFYGPVKFEKSVEIQLASDVGLALLSPSNNTGGMTGTIGNTKLFEYMMAGLPLVCTDFVLWKEIIDKWKCGICVKPDDPEELRKTLQYLHDNPDAAKEMGENGRRAVETDYNWKTQEAVLTEMYKRYDRKKQ